MEALIIGATGATGKDLVNYLLQDPDYTKVTAFVRRPTGISHPKLFEVQTDFENLDAVTDSVKGDVLFSCLGTTLKVAGSKQKQQHIDYEIPVKFAEIAKRNGVAKAVLLSSYGASATSAVFYSKLKGMLEEKMESLRFDSLVIFRPGVLVRKNSDRTGEKISIGVLKFLNVLGIIRKFRPMPTATLAEKMAKAAKGNSGKQIVELSRIFGF